MIDSIKEFIIKKFIFENDRIPSKSEINFLFKQLQEETPAIEKKGLAATEGSRYFNSNEASNSEAVNSFFKKVILDLEFLDKRFANLVSLQLENYSDRQRILEDFKNKLKLLEFKINRNILLSSKKDVFAYSIGEYFTEGTLFDYERSTAEISNNNKVTMGYKNIEKDLLNESEINYTLRHKRGAQVNIETKGTIRDLLIEDDEFLSIKSYSSMDDDIVEFILDLSFKEGKPVQEIKYIIEDINNNSMLQEEVWYSVDGVNYTGLYELNIPTNIIDKTNTIEMQNSNKEIYFKNIKIIFRKTKSDGKKDNAFYYSFVMDYIGLQKIAYKLKKESVFYCGPYEIKDENDTAINFSLASLKGGTCCEIPNRSSVDLYLSKNNNDWFKGEFSGEFNDIVSFESHEANALNFDVFDIVQTDSTYQFTVDLKPEWAEKDYELLNIYVPADNIDTVIENSIVIKRNVLKTKRNNSGTFFSGWIKEGNFYKCRFTINIPEGVYIDFGNAACILNDKMSTSKTFLKAGEHKIKIDEKYFIVHAEISNELKEKTVSSVRALKKADRYYPYNHKLLIEGFNYSPGFRGAKVYKGASDIYSSKLEKVSEVSFKANPTYNKFFIKEHQGEKYFFIQDEGSSGKLEDYSVIYRKNPSDNGGGNKLYIKGIIRTNDSRYTPKISQIQVRVI
jgi:hypothetical protein